MKFLLFLLGIIFFFIFFFFSQAELGGESFLTNIFYEANIYVGITLLFIFYVFKGERKISKAKMQEEEEYFEEQKIKLSGKDFLLFVKDFFEKYIYYVAILLFYFSLYLFLKSFYDNLDISKVFLFFNVVIGILYFIEHKFSLFQDLLRVNTLIISLYYICFQLAYITGFVEDFSLFDIGNIIFLYILFFFFITASRAKKYLSTLYSYLFAFLFVNTISLSHVFFGEIRITSAIFSFIFSIIFFTQTQLVHSVIHVSKQIIRIWGIFFSTIYIGFFISLLREESISIFLLSLGVCVISAILLLFHKVFENYISLGLSLVGIGAASVSLYYHAVPKLYELRYVYILCFFLSAVYIALGEKSSSRYLLDRYFFHSFSLVVNVIGVICLLFFGEISILGASILVAGESLYLFGSYYYFRKQLPLG